MPAQPKRHLTEFDCWVSSLIFPPNLRQHSLLGAGSASFILWFYVLDSSPSSLAAEASQLTELNWGRGQPETHSSPVTGMGNSN